MSYSIMIKNNETDEILANEETSCIIGAFSTGDDYINRVVLADTNVLIIKNCIAQAQGAVNHAIDLVKGKKMTIKEFFKSGENLAIHCDTEEKAEKLLEAFDKTGHKWRTGYSYIDLTCWDMYKKNTCYSNGGRYGEIDWYKSKKYQILEFEEIELKDTPKK